MTPLEQAYRNQTRKLFLENTELKTKVEALEKKLKVKQYYINRLNKKLKGSK